MRCLNLVALFLPLALFPVCPAAAQAPDAKSDAGANAAMKYWQAFALLPTLDEDQAKLLQNWKEAPILEGSAAQKLIDASRMCRVYLHRGAKLQRCDWNLDYEDGPGLFMSHCPRSRNLARLALLHARHEFEQGHCKAGWEDVTDVLKLGRHLEMDPMIIPNLVAYAVERNAIEAAAPYLPELKLVLPQAASVVLAAPPAGQTLSQMVLFERQISLQWLIRRLKESEQHQPGSWQHVWKEFFSPENRSSRDLREAAKSFDQAVKMLEDALPYYDQMAKVAALPWKELDAQLPEFLKKVDADSPMASYFLAGLGDTRHAQRLAQTEMALFKAALAVVEGGPDKLKDIKDPYGDGPFAYRALGRGFELKSTLLYKGKPVTLVVGQRTNE